MNYDLTYLSFGAGIQSTALLGLCLTGEPGFPRPDVVFYADTKSELVGPSGDECQNLVAFQNVYPIDLRNALRSDHAVGKGTPGTGIGEAGDPAPSVTSVPSAVAFCQEVADPLVAHGTYTHEGSGNFRTRNVVAYQVPSCGSGASPYASPISRTLDSNGGWGSGAGGTLVIPFNAAQVTHPENRSKCEPGEPAHALASSGVPESVAEAAGRWVRRLTPMECERLQGFPDGWTALDGASDAQRYKALGNAIAVPVVRWVGRRIRKIECRPRGGPLGLPLPEEGSR